MVPKPLSLLCDSYNVTLSIAVLTGIGVVLPLVNTVGTVLMTCMTLVALYVLRESEYVTT